MFVSNPDEYFAHGYSIQYNSSKSDGSFDILTPSSFIKFPSRSVGGIVKAARRPISFPTVLLHITETKISEKVSLLLT